MKISAGILYMNSTVTTVMQLSLRDQSGNLNWMNK